MSTAVDEVYELLQLRLKCQVSGLEMADIETMAAIEAQFAGPAPQVARVDLQARVRAGDDEDLVKLVAIGPATLAVIAAPYLEIGATVEIMIDDPGAGRSYRFKGRVASLDDDAGDLYRAALVIVGAPLLLRKPLRTLEMAAAQAA